MSSDTLLTAVYTATNAIIPTFRHLAPQDTERPYAVLNILPNSIYRCFERGETFQRMSLQVTLWYDWEQDDTRARSVSHAIECLLDMQTMGGILLREEGTPGFFVIDGGKGRRALQIVQNYVYEEERGLLTVLYTVSGAGNATCNGGYHRFYISDDVPSYKHVTENMYLYRIGTEPTATWIINEVHGEETTPGYYKVDAGDTPFLGLYEVGDYAAPAGTVA